MIRVLYAELGPPWDTDKMQQMMSLLPYPLKHKILQYSDQHDRQLRVIGKLLLIRMIHQFGLQSIYSLNDLQYSDFNRPYFEGDFDFNISHSGEIAVCAAISKGKIGIDIEEVRQVIPDMLMMELTAEEQKIISGDSDPVSAFYRLWTRKEALLKAIGQGVFGSLSGLNMNQARVELSGEMYYLSEISPLNSYQVAIASTVWEKVQRMSCILL